MKQPCVTCPNTRTSQPKRGAHIVQRLLLTLCLPLALCTAEASLAASAELGRLFYTPAQRAQLETARAQHPRSAAGSHPAQAPGADNAPAPLRFDGQVIRSDGKSTRWVDGKAQVGTSGVAGLKPGQIRADGKVYEPYQILRSPPPAAPDKDTPP
jgi:hypothetical protein